MVNFIKKMTGNGNQNQSGCCGVQIKEVTASSEGLDESSCCGTDNNESESSCCGTENTANQSSCCG